MQLPLLISNWTPLQANATPQNQTFLALPEKNHPYQFLLNRPVGSYELVDTLQTPELGWPATWHYEVAVQVSDSSCAVRAANSAHFQAPTQTYHLPMLPSFSKTEHSRQKPKISCSRVFQVPCSHLGNGGSHFSLLVKTSLSSCDDASPWVFCAVPCPWRTSLISLWGDCCKPGGCSTVFLGKLGCGLMGGRSPNDDKPLEIEGDVFATGTWAGCDAACCTCAWANTFCWWTTCCCKPFNLMLNSPIAWFKLKDTIWAIWVICAVEKTSCCPVGLPGILPQPLAAFGGGGGTEA